MNRGWIVAGMIGALGLGFGLGRLGDSEPPREMEAPRELPPPGGDVITPEELPVKEADEFLEFSARSKDEMFVLTYGETTRRWRPIPFEPGSLKVPMVDLGSDWGLVGLRAKPCHCTPVDPPPDMLQRFVERLQAVSEFCNKCGQLRCEEEEIDVARAGKCNACSKICG